MLIESNDIAGCYLEGNKLILERVSIECDKDYNITGHTTSKYTIALEQKE